MNLITTTELRTKTPKLVNLLLAGEEIGLIHRSKMIGTIKPEHEGKPFNAKAFSKLTESLNLPILSYQQRETNYRKHIIEKYGKGIS